MEIIGQLTINSLISGSIYALAGSGMALTYGLLRILNFAHGHIMMVGAYCFYCAAVQNSQPFGVALFLTFLFALLLSILVMRIFVMPFMRFSPLLSFVTTLALSTILESSVAMIFGVNVKSLSVGNDYQSIEMFGLYITPIQIVIIASAFSLLIALAVVIHLTSLGRKIRALAEEPYAAESLGISKSLYSYGVFMLGTVLACYAGVLVGLETNIQPTMGNAYTIKAFAAMLLGGLGNIWGTVVGSFLLGFIENFSIGLDLGDYSIPAGYKDAFSFLVILFVLLLKPQGLFNVVARRA